MKLLLSCVLCFLFIPSLALADEINLAPIVKEGTPGDVLIEDSIVPPLSGGINLNSGSGSIQNSFQNQMALPVTDYGRPGNLAQVRGFGFSAEDVDVQVMGVSMNPPQGGGFDLSTFPQYLWSGYRYQMGPALSALNQSASTGTLSLVPWTVGALNDPGMGGRAIGFYSSLGVNQLSVAAKDGKNVAVLAGYSNGTVQGPSGGLSGRWGNETYSGSVHLLATDLDAQSQGSTYFPSPLARTQNTRIIPLLQNDFRVTKTSLLKTGLFYDWGYVGYQDPSMGSQFRQYFQQWGSENVYLVDQWKLGLSGRQVNYKSLSTYGNLQVPTQNIGNIQVSRSIEVGSVSIEPTLQGVWATDFGFLPEGSLGARTEWDQGANAFYGRASFSQRTPSLLDRYLVTGDFVGNPNLQTESDWTGIVGVEAKGKKLEGTLQAYSQLKQNARVYTGSTVSNLNDAYIFALTGTGTYHLSSQLDSIYSATLSKSRLILTGYEFPYIPNFLSLAGFNLHDRREKRRWEWMTVARFSSSQVASAVTGESLPGYVTLDTSLQVQVVNGLRLSGRVEDLFDRSIELVRGFPIGRTFSVMMVGEI